MKAIIVIFSILIVIFILAFKLSLFSFPQPNIKSKNLRKLQIGDALFKVEVAEDIVSRSKGLSGWENLPEDQGMLFVFSRPGKHAFWMKGMNFPLDFVWIRDRKVVGVTENVPPGGSPLPRTVRPPTPVDMVLEINSGLVSEKGIERGDQITIK